MWSDTWQKAIAEIHGQSHPTVLAVTGGGAAAIAELLSVPGASKTILEARVPYAAQALNEWLGRTPDQYCDERTALAMASVAAARARQLLDAANLSHQDVLGIACTASLASDRPKRGDHRCFVAVQSPSCSASYALILEKGARSRAEEESLVGQLIVRCLAVACGLQNLPGLALRQTEVVQHQSQVASPELSAVWRGVADCLWSLPTGEFSNQPPQPQRALLSGAFDPLHQGHEELRSVAERWLGGPVGYELSITNVDKPPLDFLTIERRRQQFWHAPLALTNAPRFWQKAAIFPGTTFVIGSDTAERIVDVKYYNHDRQALEQALATIRKSGCQFLVAARMAHGALVKLTDLAVPAEFRDLFVELPVEQFRVDISSTELRKGM